METKYEVQARAWTWARKVKGTRGDRGTHRGIALYSSGMDPFTVAFFYTYTRGYAGDYYVSRLTRHLGRHSGRSDGGSFAVPRGVYLAHMISPKIKIEIKRENNNERISVRQATTVYDYFCWTVFHWWAVSMGHMSTSVSVEIRQLWRVVRNRPHRC